jgi:PadR family transcriptional regulator, regulatory protein PadR
MPSKFPPLDMDFVLRHARHSWSMPSRGKEERRGLFPGALEMMVLQTLRARPLHGYAIAQHIQQTSEDLLQIEEGTLYPALQRLLREGWVQAEWGVSKTNRRVRIYRITAAGRKQLQREMSSFERMLKGIARVMGPSEA